IGAVHARADLAPPDACTAPGQPCQNGGDQHNQPGTCVVTTCTKQVPTADGGLMPMTYDCDRCFAVLDGGNGGGTGGASSGGGSGTGGSSKTSSGSSGCAVAPAGGERTHAAGMILLFAALMLAVARRRTSVE